MPNPVLERLRAYDLRPRKELGQHFLIDMNVLDRLADLIAPEPGAVVLEFGAGLGVLTERLLQRGARVVGVELDDALANVLATELGDAENFTLIHEDLAGIDMQALCKELDISSLTLAGNLPYQLTSTVLFALLELEDRLQSAVLMVQREVAERIVASHGSRDYGILSVLLQAYHRVELVMRVKPGAFRPPPRVDSAVLRVTPRLEAAEAAWSDREALTRLVKSVFNERRKTLRNTLKKFYGLDAATLARCAAASGVDLGKRPEALSVGEFVRLLHALPESDRSGERPQSGSKR